MTIKAAGNKGEQSDFTALFREVRAGRKPIDALFADPTFRGYFRAIVTTCKLESEGWEELANELASKALSSLPRFRSESTRDLESEFDDLLASMQTTKSKRAVRKAFEASPAQLGRAAVKQSSRKS